MYIENGIEKLSKPQISKLLNGHKVIIKKGQGMKIHMTEEHTKKLHKAHLKGSGTTIQLDPYAIASNQHLRQDALHAMTGRGPKGLKKFEKWTGAIGDFLKPVAKPILGALTDQAVNNINAYGDMSANQAGLGLKRRGRPPKILIGSGPKGLKKFEKWTGAIGDFLKPVAKPILGALTDQAVNNINAYGDMSASQAGRGLPKKRAGRPRKKAHSDSPKVQHKKKVGRPRKGGAALPPGTPYGIY